MALWSLTKERVEKLRKQIGDKEVEIDTLIKLSKEDIWKKDLDDFLAEWRFQLEEEDRRMRKVANMGRRASSKLMTGGRAPAKKRKALGDDPDDLDFAAPKSKKSATVKKVQQPKGGLLDYLSKAPAKPEKSPTDGARDSDGDDDFEVEVLPKKSRGAPKSKPEPAPEPEPEPVAETKAEDDDDSDVEILPKKSRAAPKSKPKPEPETMDEDEDSAEVSVVEKPTKSTSQPSRTARKPVKYTVLDDSDSDNGDDLLGDVSKMVKGIGGTVGDSTALFSERSRPGSSSGLKPTAKNSKHSLSSDFDPDETDYTKLIPQNSPRRSLLVKPKDVKASDEDVEDEEEAPKTKAKPAAKAAAKPAVKARGRPKKDVAKPAAAPAAKPSPAAKAYASKQAKASKKKLADDMSDDDIDAMANDILDSPAGAKSDNSDAAPPRKTAGRPARRAAATAKKPTYVIDDDSEDDFGGDDSADDFSDSE